MSKFKREEKEFKEKILKISRVSKTTKGGRSISFSVLAAIGDEKGRIGLGLGKANGVPDAIKKAIATTIYSFFALEVVFFILIINYQFLHIGNKQ